MSKHLNPMPVLQAPEPYRPTTESLEERMTFGETKLHVARNILDQMYHLQEDGNCTELEAKLYRECVDYVLSLRHYNF